MKRSRQLLCLTTAIALTLSSTAAQAKPKIKVLATGGTIAGEQANSAEVGYKSGALSLFTTRLRKEAVSYSVSVPCIAVVRSSRTGSGLVMRNVELDDDKLGFIASMELSPQKARILLMLALINTHTPAKLQQVFMKY